MVGADGLHSNIRSLAFGVESGFVRDLGCYAAIFRTASNLDLGGWELVYSMPGKRGARGKTVGLYPLPGPGEAIAMFYFASPPMRYDRHDVAQQKKILAEAFAGEGWEIPWLLETIWEAPDFYFDRVSQVHMNRWSKGRVVLLGGAGYCGSPLGGNGTSMAMVGAYVLAGELAAAGGDHCFAFGRYEDEMRQFVTRCQRFARGAPRSMLPKSRSEIWVRNQIIKLLPHLPGKDIMGLQKTANAVPLKDYQGGGLLAAS